MMPPGITSYISASATPRIMAMLLATATPCSLMPEVWSPG
jgi:hypothetical protein